jgi:phosphoserine phosphatase RsbU/P
VLIDTGWRLLKWTKVQILKRSGYSLSPVADISMSMNPKPLAKANVRRVGLSLRYKLLLILTLIPLITLGLYLRLATKLFEKDKEAYVYDSGVAVAKSLAMQIRVEMESYLNAVKPVVEGYDPLQKTFTPQAQELFARYSRLVALVLYQGDGKSPYQKLGELTNKNMPGAILADSVRLAPFIHKASERGLFLTQDPTSDSTLLIGSRLGQVTDPTHFVFIGVYKAEALIGVFAKAQLYRNFLVDEKGEVALGPAQLKGTSLEGENLPKFFAPVLAGTLPESSFGLSNSKGQQELVSYAVVGVGDLKVASVVDRKEALKAVEVLVAKSVLFFLSLLAATVLISVFASFQLTSTLRDLYDATRRIASGKFDVRVRSKSNDEIGGLADSFNVMAAEVSRLMLATAEKARMENELATVRTVQETLFPQTENHFGNVHVIGHFEPASECGGDWWNYSEVGDKIYLWIGDATGHGAPAALITSAARSAAAIIESLDGMTPGRAMEILNRAIHETSKGKINMTFFLASLDKNTGEFIYANASHDPPFLIRRPKDRPVAKKDLLPLMDVNGLRLGEKLGSKYEEASVKLELGDSVVLYTDGILDLEDSTGKKWGERTFLKTIVEASSGGQSLHDRMSFLRRSITQFRGETVLIDDITLCIAEYKEVA